MQTLFRHLAPCGLFLLATLTAGAALAGPTPAYTTQPQDVTVEEGQPATFTSMPPAGKWRIQWYRKPAGGTYTAILNATTSSYLLPKATLADNGASYFVRSKSGSVVLDSNPALLTVKPATGNWTPTGTALYNRAGHTATRLADGRVLIAGGQGAQAEAWLSAEIYDPATNSFSRTGNLRAGRSGHRAVLMKDGRVLLTGGRTASNTPELSSEIYDPAKGVFESLGTTIITARADPFLFSLPDGKVLIAGGTTAVGQQFVNAWGNVNTYYPPVRATQIFDPVTRTASAGATMPAPGRTDTSATATVLADGRILFAGGEVMDYVSYAQDPQWIRPTMVEIYDPASGQFTAAGALPAARYMHQAILLRNGKVLLAGGAVMDSSGSAVEKSSSTLLYDPASASFSAGTPMYWGRAQDISMNHLPDGRILVFGGNPGGYQPAEVTELYDPSSATFSEGMKLYRYRYQATPLANGRILFSGGFYNLALQPSMLY